MKDILRKQIDKVIKRLFKSEEQYDVLVSEREEFGDFSTNIAFVLGKKLGKNPKEIAQKIVDELVKVKDFERVEVAGGGFINVFLAPKVYEKELTNISIEREKYGSNKSGKGKRVQAEFISANPTGPLTLGNGRGGFSGDTLVNILKKNGYNAKREYYVNDTGNQVKVLGKSVYKALGIDIEVKEGEDIYGGEYIDIVARKIKKQKGLEWINRNLEKTGEMAAKTILDEFIKKDIKFLGIKYDRWFSEKNLYKEKLVHKMWEYLKAKNLVYEREGAYWLKTSQYGDEKDRVVKKSDGNFTYLMSDVAYFYERVSLRKFDKVIMILGADHHGYVGRFNAVAEILGHKGKLEILLVQLVRLIQGGVEVRMSKRKGNFITLREAAEDMGVEAARYFFISKDYNHHIDIDLDLVKEKSNKNPIFYIQYANARIASVLAKIKNQKVKGKSSSQKSKIEFDKFELALVKKLAQYPEVVKEVGENHQVYKLPFFAHELAEAFHKFYENCKIIGDEREHIRVRIVKATGIVLKDCLSLMGIEAVKKM